MSVEDLENEIKMRELIVKGKGSQVKRKCKISKDKVELEERIYGKIRGTGNPVSVEKLLIRLSKLYDPSCDVCSIYIGDIKIKNINEFIDCRFYEVVKDFVVIRSE